MYESPRSMLLRKRAARRAKNTGCPPVLLPSSLLPTSRLAMRPFKVMSASGSLPSESRPDTGSLESTSGSYNANDESDDPNMYFGDGLGDIRSERKDQQKVLHNTTLLNSIRMNTYEEFAYNAMRGHGLGPRCASVVEVAASNPGNSSDNRPEERGLFNERRYYAPMTPAETAEEAWAQHMGMRSEIVLNHRYDEGETPNHYKGEDCLANFGYFKVNGIWTDPDGEVTIANAVKGIPDPNAGLLPGVGDGGPRAMGGEEHREFYASFDYYLSDGEGPMGSSQITPEVFKKLAEGCAGEGKGDSWATGVPVSQETFTDRPRGPPPARRSAFDPIPQVDMETGSLFSGIESHGQPSLLVSAAGVDMSRIPAGFPRMDPQCGIDHLAAAYNIPRAFDGKGKGKGKMDSPPKALKFDNTGIMKALGIPEDHEGLLMIEDLQKGMEYVRSLTTEEGKLANLAREKRFHACERLSQLIKEVHSLKHFFEENPKKYPAAFEAAKRFQPGKTPTPPFSPPPHAVAAATAKFGPELLKHLSKDLGQCKLTYLHMLEDSIYGNHQLAKHLAFLAEEWGIEEAEVNVKIEVLFGQKCELKRLSGLSEAQVLSLVPTSDPSVR